MNFIPAQLIAKKKQGQSLTLEEFTFLVESYSQGHLPDYQMSALLMAIYFKGMSDEETAHLTTLMRDSGKVLDFSHLQRPCVDKHSTGGVGDKTSLILAPLLGSLGVAVPMIAGRGLGHTGGTLDKLESIPGFRVKLSLKEFQENLTEHGFAIMGQTQEICPADKKLYALRDVTATVDSLPLICASIMSKKLAEGIQALVLDVKFGSGAFMKTLETAEALALKLKSIGEHNGLKVRALLTNMSQPLGKMVGNALEVKECVEIMRGLDCVENGIDLYQDTRELTLQLAAHMLQLARPELSWDDALSSCRHQLDSGAALESFEKMCHFQGPADIRSLPVAPHKKHILAQDNGYLSHFDCEQLGLAAVAMGAGRRLASDRVDPSAGIEVHWKVGQKINKSDLLMTLHGSDINKLDTALSILERAYHLSNSAPELEPLIYKVIE